jgi:hypothetical protein
LQEDLVSGVEVKTIREPSGAASACHRKPFAPAKRPASHLFTAQSEALTYSIYCPFRALTAKWAVGYPCHNERQ